MSAGMASAECRGEGGGGGKGGSELISGLGSRFARANGWGKLHGKDDFESAPTINFRRL